LRGFQATVEPNTVNAALTKLQIFGAIKTDLEDGDYIMVTLPSQAFVRSSNDGSPFNLTCVFVEPPAAPITSCVSLSSQVIKLTIGGPLSYYFQFDVL
jgi:hypothetical protein